MKRNHGFTLIEAVLVIVILGITAGLLAPLIASLVESYQLTRAQADLTARGRLALERIAREVRHAVPGTLRTLGGGDGIEFVRSRTGGIYVHEADDFGAEFADSNKRFPLASAARTQLYALVPGSFSVTAGERLVIGNTSPTTFANSAAALTGTTATDAGADGTTTGVVLDFNSFTFNSGYSGRRFTVADQVVDIGRNGSFIRWHAVAIPGTGIGSYNNAADWGAGDPMLIDGVSAVSFAYAPGVTHAAGILQMQLTLTDGAWSATLYQEVQVRNTP